MSVSVSVNAKVFFRIRFIRHFYSGKNHPGFLVAEGSNFPSSRFLQSPLRSPSRALLFGEETLVKNFEVDVAEIFQGGWSEEILSGISFHLHLHAGTFQKYENGRGRLGNCRRDE